MDLDFKDRRLKELEVLVEASQEEVIDKLYCSFFSNIGLNLSDTRKKIIIFQLKSVTVQLSVAERNLDALSIEANSLQKDTKEAEVGQELAVEELKALKKWVAINSRFFALTHIYIRISSGGLSVTNL